MQHTGSACSMQHEQCPGRAHTSPNHTLPSAATWGLSDMRVGKGKRARTGGGGHPGETEVAAQLPSGTCMTHPCMTHAPCRPSRRSSRRPAPGPAPTARSRSRRTMWDPARPRSAAAPSAAAAPQKAPPGRRWGRAAARSSRCPRRPTRPARHRAPPPRWR